MNSYGSNWPLTAEGRGGGGVRSLFRQHKVVGFFFFTNVGTTDFKFTVILFRCSLTTSYSFCNVFRNV